MTMSRWLIRSPNPGIANSRSKPFPFSLIFAGIGWMRCERRRTNTASRVGASISPASTSPRAETPCQRKTAIFSPHFFGEGARKSVGFTRSSPSMLRGEARHVPKRSAVRRPRARPQHRAHLVQFRRVADRLVVRDQSALEKIDERLRHRLHAELDLPHLHLRVDLMNLLFADEIADGCVGTHHFDRQDPALAVRTRNELLRDHAVENE